MPQEKLCPFCETPASEKVSQNTLAYARRDKYPVSEGHTLIIPNRHFASFFEATNEEKTSLWALVDQLKTLLDEKHKPDGYNIGINLGETAGQTILHCHIHLIPRYQGDQPNPKGGVRRIFPDKADYEAAP